MGVSIGTKTKKEKLPEASTTTPLGKILSFEMWGNGQLSDKEKEAFYQYVSTLSSSGLQLPKALTLFSEERLHSKTLKVAIGLVQSVNSGKSLSEAMEISGAFDPYEYYSVAIGEETGRLGEILQDLKRFFENKIKQNRKLRGVMVYPIVVLSISVLAVWFLLSYVVPLFVDIYKRFGGELPLVTRIIVSTSEFINKWAGLILVIFVSVIMTWRYFRKSEVYRRISSRLLLALPVIGELLRQVHLSRFTNSMNLMLKSNISFIRSLDMLEKMTGFYPLQRIIPMLRQDILKGGLVHEAFSRHSIFDRQMVTLIRVGEEVNKLDQMFAKITTNYEENLNHKISIINTLVEPVIIIFLGLVIGFILVAMYMPLFDMGNQMIH